MRRFARRALLAAALAAAAGTACADAPAGGEDAAAADPAVAAILALTADPAYGAYLAGECVTCHRPSGGEGIPRISGLPLENLVTALVEYRSGVRDNEVMRTTAARLGDAEIAALAAHFSAQDAD